MNFADLWAALSALAGHRLIKLQLPVCISELSGVFSSKNHYCKRYTFETQTIAFRFISTGDHLDACQLGHLMATQPEVLIYIYILHLHLCI